MSFSRTTDFVYAFRIITLLSTPWKEQTAFKLGIIDEKGNVLKRQRDLTTPEEKSAYTYLHRLVYNLKRLLQTIPGGKSWVGAATASLILLREDLEEFDFGDAEWAMIEEAIMNLPLDEEMPTNATGSGVSTDTPKPMKKPLKRTEPPAEEEDDDE